MFVFKYISHYCILSCPTVHWLRGSRLDKYIEIKQFEVYLFNSVMKFAMIGTKLQQVHLEKVLD